MTTTAAPAETQQTTETPEDAAPTEQEAAPVVPADETAKPAEAASGDEADEDAEAPEEETPEQKRRGRSGWKREIRKLEMENRALMDRLLAAQADRLDKGPAEAKEKTAEEKAEVQAAEWVNSLVAKRLDAERAAQRERDIQAAATGRAMEFKKLHPDFEEVLLSADGVPVSAAVSEALLTSEQGPAIMYLLASNPAELARISALPPLDAVRAIGRLEAQAASSTASPTATTKSPARKPAAPAPIAPVTARGPSKVKRPEEMSYEEYSAWRESSRKR